MTPGNRTRHLSAALPSTSAPSAFSSRPRRQETVRTALFALAFVLGLAASAALGQQAPDPITVDVDSALGDSCEAGWLPVRVRVANNGEGEARGRVVVRYLIYGKDLRAEAYSAEAFPKQSRRDLHYLLFVPPVSHSDAEVEAVFEPEGHGAERSARLSLNRFAALRFTSIARVPGLMSDLHAKLAPQNPPGWSPVEAIRYAARDARLDTLPAHWLGYERFNLVLLQDANVGELSQAQRDALVEWVEAGGNLLVSPGPDPLWLENDVLQRLIDLPPVQPKAVRRVDGLDRYGKLNARENFPFYTFEGGTPRLAKDTPPWLWEYRAGLGTVWMLGVDLGRPPFTGWLGRPDWWQDVVGTLPTPPCREPWSTDNVETHRGPASQQLLDPRVDVMSRGMSRLPSMILLFVLVLVYLVVVGPVNYVVLRRLNLHIYTVVTVPLIALGFVGVIVMIGYATRGVTTKAQAASLTRVAAGGTRGLVTAYGCVYSAAASSYRIGFGEGLTPLPIFATRAEASAQVLRLGQGAATSLEDFHLKLWDTGVFQARGWTDLGGTLRATRRAGTITVANAGKADLVKAVVIGRNRTRSSEVFAAAPGATLDVAVTASQPAAPETFAEALGLPIDEFPVAWVDHVLERARAANSGLFVLARLEADPAHLQIDGRDPAFLHRIPLLLLEVVDGE